MKKRSKVLSVILALVMALTMSALAFADDTTPVTHKITITDKQSAMNYEAFQVFAGQINYPDDDTAKVHPELVNITWGNGVDGDAVIADLKDATNHPKLAEVFGSLLSKATASEVAEKLSGKASNTGNIAAPDAAFLDEFAQVVYAHKTANKTTSAAGTQDATDTTKYNHEITGLSSGYYLVASEDGHATSESLNNNGADTMYILQLVDKDIAVNAKTDTPTVEKKILDPDTRDYNTAGVGEIVEYQVKVKIPDMSSYKTYMLNVEDHLSKGLTFIDGSCRIAIGGKYDEANAVNLTRDVNYHINPGCTKPDEHMVDPFANSTAQTITFGNAKTLPHISEHVGDYIYITYKAVVNKDAVIGVKGNPNEVRLQYSNKPEDTSSFEYTPWDEVKTFVTQIVLNKKDAETQAALAGAEFELKCDNGYKINCVVSYDEKGNITDVTTKKIEGTTESNVNPIDVAYDKTLTTGSDGQIIFTGLPAGTYTLTETKAPNGYNLMVPGSITFKIDCLVKNANVMDGESEKGINDDVTTTGVRTPGTTPGTADCVWTVNGVAAEGATGVDGQMQVSELTMFANQMIDADPTDNTIASFVVNVMDAKGSQLPSTGGMGTTILYIVGAVLVVGAAILLITKKRMATAKNQ